MDEPFVVWAFWWLLGQLSRASRVAVPCLMLMGAVTWFVRSRSAPAYVALIGAGVHAGSEICRRVYPVMYDVWVRAPSPAAGQNELVDMLWMHGQWMGLTAFFAAVMVHFARAGRAHAAHGRERAAHDET